MAKNTSIVKTLEGLPWILRVILTFVYGAFGNVVRFFRSLEKGNIVGIILSVILLFAGGLFILWIIDIVCVLQNKPYWWID